MNRGDLYEALATMPEGPLRDLLRTVGDVLHRPTGPHVLGNLEYNTGRLLDEIKREQARAA